jgi:serine/threonine protein kinase
LDVWSVGAILIAFLTGRFPFFHSYDEADALIEIAILFGQVQMKRAAASFGRGMTASLWYWIRTLYDLQISSDRQPFVY